MFAEIVTACSANGLIGREQDGVYRQCITGPFWGFREWRITGPYWEFMCGM